MEWQQGEFQIAIPPSGNSMTLDGVVSPPFAVDRRREHEWVVTHLPSGFALPYRFLTVGDATTAADAIFGVLNCWDDPFISNNHEMWSTQVPRIREAIKKSGAEYTRNSPKEIQTIRTALNGYEALS